MVTFLLPFRCSFILPSLDMVTFLLPFPCSFILPSLDNKETLFRFTFVSLLFYSPANTSGFRLLVCR